MRGKNTWRNYHWIMLRGSKEYLPCKSRKYFSSTIREVILAAIESAKPLGKRTRSWSYRYTSYKRDHQAPKIALIVEATVFFLFTRLVDYCNIG